MSTEIRRLRIDGVADHQWTWTDVVTRQRGRLDRDREDVAIGDEVLVEIAAKGAGWRAVRWLSPGPVKDVQRDEDVAPILRDGRPVAFPDEGIDDVVPGVICLLHHNMDRRSTAARDRGRSEKSRPAVVLQVDRVANQASVSFLFGTNSSVRRTGTGRRIEDWRGAGLRKPSIVSAEVEVRSLDDLGPAIGRLTGSDHAKLIAK